MTDHGSACLGVQRFGDLVGVPSWHYDPFFAQVVRRVFRDERFDVVALELPPTFAAELRWAADRWPEPVASLSAATFLPVVPGDSILEAYRQALASDVDVAFVDLDLVKPEPRRRAALPRPELLA